jgi:hypothetical protein
MLARGTRRQIDLRAAHLVGACRRPRRAERVGVLSVGQALRR